MQRKSVVLSVLTLLVVACESPSAPGISIPDDTSPPKAVVANLYRGRMLKVNFPDHTFVAASNDPLLSRATATHYVNFYCRGVGAGGFHIQISGNNHIHGLINCLPQFRVPVKRPYNLAAYFRDYDGRTVTSLGVYPSWVARQGAIRTAFRSVADGQTQSALTTFHQNLFSEEGSYDIGVECDKEGVATLIVYFSPTDSPSSESFTLECAPEHDQGGGG